VLGCEKDYFQQMLISLAILCDRNQN
jgi:hypothetical protein